VVDGQQDTVIEDATDDRIETFSETVGIDDAEEPTAAAADLTGEESESVTADGPADADSDDADDAAADDDSEDDDSEDDDSEDSEDSEDSDSDNPLEIEGEVAADYLEELLDIADLDGDIDTYVENDRAHVSVLTDSDVLVGKDGEVLEALQELARLAVITETGNRSRLMLDIAGYRERRRKALTELATDAVGEAKETGEAVRLAPMNPFERKIVHDVVAAAGLTSESEGEEPQRRVVILPSA
jgi:spoIIIJ-associated protein